LLRRSWGHWCNPVAIVLNGRADEVCVSAGAFASIVAADAKPYDSGVT
jgi:hypothetical protein